MNYLDIIILVPLVWGIYRGFSKGLVVEVASLLALIVGLWCAIHFSEFTAKILLNDIGLDMPSSYLSPVSFAVTFVVVAIVIVFVSNVIDRFLSAVALGGINKLFGAVFGALKVLLIMAIVLYFVNGVDAKTNFIDEGKKDESLLYRPLLEFVEKMVPQIDVDEIKKRLPDFDMEDKLNRPEKQSSEVDV